MRVASGVVAGVDNDAVPAFRDFSYGVAAEAVVRRFRSGVFAWGLIYESFEIWFSANVLTAACLSGATHLETLSARSFSVLFA